MKLIEPYIRYRELIGMRLLTGLSAAGVGTDGRIFPRAIGPIKSHESLEITDLFTRSASDFAYDYEVYVGVMKWMTR